MSSGKRRRETNDTDVRPGPTKKRTIASLPPLTDLPAAIVQYFPDALQDLDPATLFQSLLAEVQGTLAQGSVRLFGKWVQEPRLASLHGAAYEYSHKKMVVHPRTPTLERIEERVLQLTGASRPYDVVLVNFYRDGNDSIAYHSDDERAIDQTDVASVSLGAERLFRMQRKQSEQPRQRKITHAGILAAGSLLWMKGQCQRLYKHELPKQPNVLQPRLNVTFRRLRSPQ